MFHHEFVAARPLPFIPRRPLHFSVSACPEFLGSGGPCQLVSRLSLDINRSHSLDVQGVLTTWYLVDGYSWGLRNVIRNLKISLPPPPTPRIPITICDNDSDKSSMSVT